MRTAAWVGCVLVAMACSKAPKKQGTQSTAVAAAAIRIESCATVATADADPSPPATAAATKTLRAVAFSTCPGTVTGSAVLRVSIGADGKPATVLVNGLGDASVEDCLAAAVRALTFPPGEVRLRCELSIGAPAALRGTLRPDATVAELTSAAFRVNGKDVITLAELMANGDERSEPIATALGPDPTRSQLVISVGPETRGDALNLLAHHANRAGFPSFALRMTSTPPGAPTLSTNQSPSRPRSGASILLMLDAVVLGASALPPIRIESDAGLGPALQKLRATVPVTDSIELAIWREPPVARLIDLMQAAAAVGFDAFVLLPPSALSHRVE